LGSFGIANTGYEFSRIGVRKLEGMELIEIEEYLGLACEKCGAEESNAWYHEKLINNYLPDTRILCEKCAEKTGGETK
jgi:hypothetical protein